MVICTAQCLSIWQCMIRWALGVAGLVPHHPLHIHIRWEIVVPTPESHTRARLISPSVNFYPHSNGWWQTNMWSAHHSHICATQPSSRAIYYFLLVDALYFIKYIIHIYRYIYIFDMVAGTQHNSIFAAEQPRARGTADAILMMLVYYIHAMYTICIHIFVCINEPDRPTKHNTEPRPDIRSTYFWVLQKFVRMPCRAVPSKKNRRLENNIIPMRAVREHTHILSDI